MGFLSGSLKVAAGILQKLFSENGSFCVAYSVRGTRKMSSVGIAKRSGNHSSSSRNEMREGKKLQEWDLNVFFTISKELKTDEKFLQKMVRFQRMNSQGNDCDTVESCQCKSLLTWFVLAFATT